MRALTLWTIGLMLVAVSPVWAQPITAPLTDPVDVPDAERIENWTGKTIIVFSPHPDDETYSCAGTMARLTDNGNTVYVVMFTNGNKGSRDPEMTRERLARIRKAEDEASNAIVGVPKENIIRLGYDDGDLEYADPKRLRGELARLMKKYRPDAVFLPDPGSKWVQWHKTDHRAAANVTQDALIAAEWNLYYPEHLLDEGLEPYMVPLAYYYYSQEPNYEVDITDVFDRKIDALAAHASQFEPSLSKYIPEMPAEVKNGLAARLREYLRSGGRVVERFRRVVSP